MVAVECKVNEQGDTGNLAGPARAFGLRARKRERGAMLLAYGLAGLSALEARYAGVDARPQSTVCVSEPAGLG
jgi:hypothetical protein